MLTARSVGRMTSEEDLKPIFYRWTLKVLHAVRRYQCYYDSLMSVRKAIGLSLDLWVIEELTIEYGVFDRLSCLPRGCLWDANIAWEYEEEVMYLHRAVLELVELGVVRIDGNYHITPTAELQPYD